MTDPEGMLQVVGHLVLALAAVIAAGRLLAVVCRSVGQPVVVGEVIAGILLGPSLLGLVWPAAYAFLLPQSLQPLLGRVAELGIVFYMFLVGLELDDAALERSLRSTVLIALGSIFVPFALGALLAVCLPASIVPSDVSWVAYVLFVGVATAIVAFPVLARILAESGLTRTDLGIRAIGAAAVSDLVIWCVLAFVVGIAHAAGGQALSVSVGAAVFVFVLLGIVRPVVGRLVRARGDKSSSPILFLAAIAGLLAAAAIANRIGIHAVIGAFLFGAVIPHDSALAATLTRKLEKPVTIFILPAFFAFIGMKTEIGLVSGLTGWLITIAIVGVAAIGKIGGTYLTARLVGRPHDEAKVLGILMNTRGLMELVVLNIGLELGLITPALFAMMVVMALATTMMTMPLLRRALARQPKQ
jgi:Kef-type K+ transport system membrane component KefB